jgi:hypothetical protein
MYHMYRHRYGMGEKNGPLGFWGCICKKKNFPKLQLNPLDCSDKKIVIAACSTGG